jgi:CheY-like chemotaxis protein
VAFRPKLLIVEDDRSTLALFEETLPQAGADSRVLASGREAVALLEKEKFDGFILHWRLPDMEARELVERIRASPRHLHAPIVMLTGAAQPGAMQESFKAGVTFFLRKPVTKRQLLNLLNASRGSMAEERRRYQRVSVALRARVRWGKEDVAGRCTSLSASGCLVEAGRGPAPRSEVRVEIELPGRADPVALGARVVNVRSADGSGKSVGVAAEFQFREDTARDLLVEFVEKRLAEAAAR